MPSQISPDCRIHPGVQLGEDAFVDSWVILGYSSRNLVPVALQIGRDAVIRSHTVIYAGSVIGDGFQTGHGALIRESNQIGDRVSIGSHSVIEHHVQVADGVRVHSGVFIPEFSVLEEGAWVGPHAVFTNAPYPLAPNAKATLRGPRLLAGAKVGANATLLPGVVLGRNSLVGAGSVVTEDVPDEAIVAGNPARILRRVHEVDAYAFLGADPEATVR
jgi:acetyltransferase-like isoleucine patch superfamily enzyme